MSPSTPLDLALRSIQLGQPEGYQLLLDLIADAQLVALRYS